MSNVQIPNLGAAISLNGAEQLEAVQAGTSVRVTTQQIANLATNYGVPVTKTANFTVADSETWLIVNNAGTVTVTLPAASSWPARILTIKTIQAQSVISASSNVVPRIGGAAGTAILPATDGAWATLVSDGTSWEIMAGS
jgi:hypothetical protein